MRQFSPFLMCGCLRQCIKNSFKASSKKQMHTNSKSRRTLVKFGPLSPRRVVADHILCPPYIDANALPRHGTIIKNKIYIKSKEEIAVIREACQIAKEVLRVTGRAVMAGVKTDELDQVAHEECMRLNVYPSPLGYRGFPKSICTSVNNVVCHGIPDEQPLEEGDVVSIDVTVYHKGFHGDLAKTYIVGQTLDDEIKRLVDTAEFCRDSAINICGPGVELCKIGETIGNLAETAGFHVVQDFCGHGIGQSFHEAPDILHYCNDEKGKMEEGMTFTIEPVLCDGGPAIEILQDRWSAVTKDKCWGAQFEHTILITQMEPRFSQSDIFLEFYNCL